VNRFVGLFVIERPRRLRTAFALVAALAMHRAAFGENVCEAVNAQPLKVENAQTYVYKSIGKADLRLHIFTPKDLRPSDRRAAIVFFFGGGWISGTVEQFVPQAHYLARRGMVAAVADYRVLCRQHSTPFDSVADARAAIRWLRTHAAELGIDPERIAAGGGSAGGHLALSSGVFAGHEVSSVSSKPNALVLFNPVIDVTRDDDLPFFGPPLVKGAAAISPFQHVHNGLPSMLILTGKADTDTPYATAEKYCSAAVAMGDDCRLVGYDDAKHGFFNPEVEGGRWYRSTLLEADRFLTSIGYLPIPASSEIP